MQVIYKLEVRGQVLTVGSFDLCVATLHRKYGWVPVAVFDAVLKVKMEPIGIVGSKAG